MPDKCKVTMGADDNNNEEMTDICQLEAIRKLNMEDNKAVLARLMKDLKDMAPLPPLKKPGTVKRRDSAPAGGRSPKRRRSSVVRCDPYATPRITRSLSKKPDNGEDEPTGKLKLLGGLFKPRNREMDFAQEISDDESDDDCVARKRRRTSVRAIPHVVRSPDDISEEDLAMVADKGIVKKYDTVYGTSCHQCRQKTLDMKTVCRNEECVGVRGQFCGVCLLNRYGEDARKALKDPNWNCPPCRRICNCSICRTRNGKFATGILVHLAHEHGYNNVHDYLVSLREKTNTK